MAAVDVASLKTVAVQLRALSADPDNQPIVAREEGCLSALVSFIAGQEPDICGIALAAMRYLSGHPDNTELLHSETELLDALKDAAVAPHLDDAATADAIRVLRALVPETAAEETMEIDALERRRRHHHEQPLAPQQPPEPEPEPPEEETPQTALRLEYDLLEDKQLARLHVPGLSTEELRSTIEMALVRQRGVLSVSFEIGPEIAVVYSRVPDDALVEMLGILSDREVELLPPDESETEEDTDPAAPSEEEEEVETQDENEDQNHPDAGYVDHEAKMRYRKHVHEQQKRTTLVHGGGTSLAARLEEQRRAEQRQQARTGRLLNRIGKGFSSGWGFW